MLGWKTRMEWNNNCNNNTWTDSLCQEKQKEEGDLPAFKIALMQRHNNSKITQKLIRATRNNTKQRENQRNKNN